MGALLPGCQADYRSSPISCAHLRARTQEDIVQKQRLTVIIGGCLAIASLWLSPALADVYHYRDAQGQLHLTNVRARIPSAYRNQADRNRRPELGGPTQAVEAPTRQQPALTMPSRVEDETAPRPSAASPQARSVDARAFGLLSLRMSDFEVLRRLGPPAAISDVGLRALAPEGSSNRAIRVTESTQTWYYPGTARTPATRLVFQGGTLVNKFRADR